MGFLLLSLLGLCCRVSFRKSSARARPRRPPPTGRPGRSGGPPGRWRPSGARPLGGRPVGACCPLVAGAIRAAAPHSPSLTHSPPSWAVRVRRPDVALWAGQSRCLTILSHGVFKKKVTVFVRPPYVRAPCQRCLVPLPSCCGTEPHVSPEESAPRWQPGPGHVGPRGFHLRFPPRNSELPGRPPRATCASTAPSACVTTRVPDGRGQAAPGERDLRTRLPSVPASWGPCLHTGVPS